MLAINKNWGFEGQIKSFRGPHLARGLNVVHALKAPYLPNYSFFQITIFSSEFIHLIVKFLCILLACEVFFTTDCAEFLIWCWFTVGFLSKLIFYNLLYFVITNKILNNSNDNFMPTRVNINEIWVSSTLNYTLIVMLNMFFKSTESAIFVSYHDVSKLSSVRWTGTHLLLPFTRSSEILGQKSICILVRPMSHKTFLHTIFR